MKTKYVNNIIQLKFTSITALQRQIKEPTNLIIKLAFLSSHPFKTLVIRHVKKSFSLENITSAYIFSNELGPFTTNTGCIIYDKRETFCTFVGILPPRVTVRCVKDMLPPVKTHPGPIIKHKNATLRTLITLLDTTISDFNCNRYIANRDDRGVALICCAIQWNGKYVRPWKSHFLNYVRNSGHGTDVSKLKKRCKLAENKVNKWTSPAFCNRIYNSCSVGCLEVIKNTLCKISLPFVPVV